MRKQFDRSYLLEAAIAKIRDKDTAPIDFRRNMRRIGRYLFYEALKNIEMVDTQVQTPLALANTKTAK